MTRKEVVTQLVISMVGSDGSMNAIWGDQVIEKKVSLAERIADRLHQVSNTHSDPGRDDGNSNHLVPQQKELVL